MRGNGNSRWRPAASCCRPAQAELRARASEITIEFLLEIASKLPQQKTRNHPVRGEFSVVEM
jgi:hypothetical protein